MTYETEQAKIGRKPHAIIEMDLTDCTLTYGGGLLSPQNGACTANGGSGNECYNTRKTCQDPTNFTAGTNTLLLCKQTDKLPIGTTYYPCIIGDIKIAPSELKTDGVSLRETISFTVEDFAHHDRELDPYVSNRASAAAGTFFGRLFSRNPHYVGRVIRYKPLYISGDRDWSNSKTRLYIIDSVEGPFYRNGRITYNIKGKDLLNLAKNRKIQIPAPSDGKLAVAWTAGGSPGGNTLTLNSDATLTDYPTGGGIVSIGDNILSYTSRSGAVLSGVTGGQWGTTDVNHAVDDTVQICKRFTGTVVSFVHDILVNYAGVASAYVPYGTSPQSDLDVEENAWYNNSIDTLIVKPTGAMQLLEEMADQFQFNLFWDGENQVVKLEANAPLLGNPTITEWNDTNHLIQDTIQVRDVPELRLSRVITYYDIEDFSKDELSNFKRINATANTDNESSDQYGEIALKQQESRWFRAGDENLIEQYHQRAILRFADMPKIMTCQVDAKDSSVLQGDVIDVNTKYLQDYDGSNLVHRMQVMSRKEVELGHRYEYKLVTFIYARRFGFIADDALASASPQVTYDTATDAQKQSQAFAGNDDGSAFSDGQDPHVIV